VIPKRKVARFSQLNPIETQDLCVSAQEIGSVVEKEYHRNGIHFGIQDGKEAGQTIFHVHIHIMPKGPGDFAKAEAEYKANKDRKLTDAECKTLVR